MNFILIKSKKGFDEGREKACICIEGYIVLKGESLYRASRVKSINNSFIPRRSK